MKKIVALVLCLALALSLATVAMADNTSSTLKASDKYAIWAVGENGTNVALKNGEDADITKTVTGNSTASDGTVTYTAISYTVGTDTYYEVDASQATFKLVKDGKFIVALGKGTVPTANKKVTSKTTGVDDPACGQYSEYVYFVDNTPYAADGTANNWYLYNGKMISLATTKTTPKAHTFTDDYTMASTAKDAKVATFTCDDCGKTFKVVDKLDVSYTGVKDVNYVEQNVGGTTYYVLVSTPASGSTGSDGVESAETFDAGIAVYAGMALASVAGSAVVIGKKKEF